MESLFAASPKKSFLLLRSVYLSGNTLWALLFKDPDSGESPTTSSSWPFPSSQPVQISEEWCKMFRLSITTLLIEGIKQNTRGVQMSLYFSPRLASAGDTWLDGLPSLFLSQLTDSSWLLISLSPERKASTSGNCWGEVMDLLTSCPSSQMTNTGEVRNRF